MTVPLQRFTASSQRLHDHTDLTARQRFATPLITHTFLGSTSWFLSLFGFYGPLSAYLRPVPCLYLYVCTPAAHAAPISHIPPTYAPDIRGLLLDITIIVFVLLLCLFPACRVCRACRVGSPQGYVTSSPPPSRLPIWICPSSCSRAPGSAGVLWYPVACWYPLLSAQRSVTAS